MPARRILVIEDRADFRLLLKRILEREGFVLSAAENGAEGLRLFRSERPDLVLLDVQLPDATGFDLCREIRRDAGLGRVPVIFISVKSSSDDVIEGMRAGGDDYIFKPFDNAEVLARVDAALRRARAGLPHSPQEGRHGGAPPGQAGGPRP